MNHQKAKHRQQLRRRRHVRRNITGTAERPRLAVYRSLGHIYAQLIDDMQGQTLVAAASSEKAMRAAAAEAAKGAAAKAEAAKVSAAKSAAAETAKPETDKAETAKRGAAAKSAGGPREGGHPIHQSDAIPSNATGVGANCDNGATRCGRDR